MTHKSPGFRIAAPRPVFPQGAVRRLESLQLADIWKASVVEDIVGSFDPARYGR